MKQFYSITINPSPYKKWDWGRVMRMLRMHSSVQFVKKFKNYKSMDSESQKELLQAVLHYFLCQFDGLDCYDGNYELTKLGCVHLHTHFSHFLGPLRAKQLEDVQEEINQLFSSGNQHKAVLVEATQVDIKYWVKYEKKDEWLTCLTSDNFPEEE